MNDIILSVENLTTAFDTENGRAVAVDGVSFNVRRGKTLGIVGESGCGKSVTALSIIRLLPQPMGNIIGGKILFQGEDLIQSSPSRIQQIRGGSIGMIFQEPLTALNPLHRIGQQIAEVLHLHRKITKRQAWDESVHLLKKVGIPSPEIRALDYPHQLSGGMRQRVVIAMALACNPALIIADEPTTALDVTIQAQILELIKELQSQLGMSVIMITHDLGVIAETCDEVVVMYAGRVAEKGTIDDVFDRPAHLYTKGLLESIPRLEYPRKTHLPTIKGHVPGLHQLPVGARFAPRSPHPDAATYMRSEAYLSVRPELVEISPGHWVEDCPVCRVDALPA